MNRLSSMVSGLSFDAPDLFASFEVKKLARASVAWLNLRYWAQLGWSVATDSDRRALEKHVLANWAWAIPQPVDRPDDFIDETCELLADRYGAPNGASHGGSARAGTIGGYILKGVGRNLLAGDDADRYHSDGHLWLHEAVKDAVYSELTWLECPNKALSTAAIIDTGLLAEMPDGGRIGRRAILLRPFPIRFAHLERSLFFGTSGSSVTDQYKDARRVEQIEKLVFDGVEPNECALYLAKLINRVAKQIGFCRFWKLSHDFTSSNTSIDGRLLDFGGFYCLPDWRRVRREAWLMINQEDLSDFSASLTVLALRLQRTGMMPAGEQPDALTRLLSMAAYGAFVEEVSDIVDVGFDDEIRKDIIGAILGLYYVSQNECIDFSVKNRNNPEHDRVLGMLNGSDKIADSDLGRAIGKIRALLLMPRNELGSLRGRAAMTRLTLAIKPRDRLMLEQAEIEIAAITDPRLYDTPLMQTERIQKYILDIITDCRRPKAIKGAPSVPVAYATDLIKEIFFERALDDDRIRATLRNHTSISSQFDHSPEYRYILESELDTCIDAVYYIDKNHIDDMCMSELAPQFSVIKYVIPTMDGDQPWLDQ